MSTPNEPQNPYGAGEPQQRQEPGAAPQYPATPPPSAPGAPQYPSAGGAPQYPAAAPYGQAPGGYGQPAPGYGATYPKNSLGVWSLVLGIVSFVLSCGLFTGIPAVIVGNNAKKAVARGEANNGGMATAGVILGWVAIALSVLGAILLAVLFSNAEFRDAFNEGYNSSY
ncbi:DUF4190 domain-containing protein [Cellulomonas fengjieae]|uniref:DUF4190 domain-containing protein n=1 Tax=Cellulomonas fengjieae TaxID=2819978 RepID=A0ABS3SJB3_9CELL|nr:DUF4190 domain-containing protein [Cellulomonas fengjieae]MBO3085830.1 DUF4190 domain-containing protein [Cellulomonas fengjieae]QVI67468.1 DUF4190 domain-containing protein [Cellulomonas fengjieae]